MNQQEKTKRTKERILAAALAEFGTNSYESASINTICSKSQISKGLIYHNFQSKDDLYLQCVRICYDQMLEYLKTHMIELQEVPDRLRSLFLLRQTFFSEHPYYANIFFHSILWPPAHLLDEIQAIRTDFDQFYMGCYRAMLPHLPLREGITEDTALEYFSIFAESFNGYFQNKAAGNHDYHTLVEDHEDKLSGMLDILLYGIAAPENRTDTIPQKETIGGNH